MTFESILDSLNQIDFRDLEKLKPEKRLEKFEEVQRDFKEVEKNINQFTGTEEVKGLLEIAEAKRLKEYAAALKRLNAVT